ncbi:MAG: hypothetical protein NUV37_03110, partial [Nanoarchaeota archaeon]|nr:hypothetical protein [Nanoarchaeota archaeon]
MKNNSGSGGKFLLVFAIVIIAVVGVFVSAGLGNWWNSITGEATSDTTTVTVTLGNTAPQVRYVEVLAAQDPNAGAVKDVNFLMVAIDADGIDD